MTYAVYVQYQKAAHFTEALVKGFPGKKVNLQGGRKARGLTHVIGGLQFGALELLQQIRAERERYIFFDNAYFGGGTRTDRLRLTLNGYQKARIDGEDRPARDWGVAIEPWRPAGEFVLVVPPSEAVTRLFGLEAWLDATLARLRSCTTRPVRVSPKADRDKSPLRARLESCHAVVTWSSNVAVEAVCMGVPAFVSGESAARPVCRGLEALEGQIEDPLRVDDERRAAWQRSLAWGQFTVDEIASGFAREVLEGRA